MKQEPEQKEEEEEEEEQWTSKDIVTVAPADSREIELGLAFT